MNVFQAIKMLASVILMNSYRTTSFFPLITLVLSVISSAHPAQSSDYLIQRGEKLFKKCVHCHTYQQGQNHRIGPNLYGMFGRKAGGLEDFDYSDAWKKADFVWDNETLNTYLKAPHKLIPNNRMPFDGLSRPKDRRALIIYMRKIVVP